MSRGLLTEMERKAMKGEIEDPNQYSTYISRVRKRLSEDVIEDIEILEEYQPELYELLRDAVIEE